jgi:hypothetical protein
MACNDDQQTVKTQKIPKCLVEDQQGSDDNLTYISLVMRSYRTLGNSRLVVRQETDLESLTYFQKMINQCLPRTRDEIDFRNTIRNIYREDKTGFNKYLETMPHLVLLTEARAMVTHFGIQDHVYIEWKDGSYRVVNNEKFSSMNGSEKRKAIAAKRRGRGGRGGRDRERPATETDVSSERSDRRKRGNRNQELLQAICERMDKMETLLKTSGLEGEVAAIAAETAIETPVIETVEPVEVEKIGAWGDSESDDQGKQS